MATPAGRPVALDGAAAALAVRRRRAGLWRARPTRIWVAALVGLAALVAAAIGIGSVAIPIDETVGILLRRALGLDIGITWTPAAETIVWDLRVPRALTAIVVGAGLALAGATLQGLLRNPLADPYVLGTASGAALGAAVAYLIPVRIVWIEFGLLHGLAFAGALLSIAVVYRLSRLSPWGGMTNLLLTGYAVGALLAAGLAMAMYLSGANLRQIFAFLLGGLESSSWTRLGVALPIFAIAAAGILVRARALNGLLLGEEAAGHLGIDVGRQRAILLALASLATAAAVALTGLIGFIGLVVPHVVRLIVGPDARRVLPFSIVGGAALLTAADLGARVLGDIPVGVVTAIVGAPFFLAILRQARHGYQL
jgi:iron complex transport system permease protein